MQYQGGASTEGRHRLSTEDAEPKWRVADRSDAKVGALVEQAALDRQSRKERELHLPEDGAVSKEWQAARGGRSAHLVDRMRHAAFGPILVHLAQPTEANRRGACIGLRCGEALREAAELRREESVMSECGHTLLRTKVGGAHCSRKACLVAARKTVPQGWLLPWLKILRAPMRLHHLQLIATHALERSAAGCFKGGASQAVRVDCELCADYTTIWLCALATELAKERLSTAFERARTVGVASVEK